MGAEKEVVAGHPEPAGAGNLEPEEVGGNCQPEGGGGGASSPGAGGGGRAP